MPAFSIRPYEPADRAAVLRIAADTAFFGEPVEAFLDDRWTFLDVFYTYYTDLEPEHAWVACADREVIGFLVGCVDTRAKEPKVWRRIYPRLAANLLRGKYRIGKKSLRYLLTILGSVLRREFARPHLDQYPAHLHINLQAGWRGGGLGGRLIEAYIQQLRALDIPGVHLSTTSLNEAACHLYEKMGFRLLEAHPTRLWKSWFDRTVENRCYGLKLNYDQE